MMVGKESFVALVIFAFVVQTVQPFTIFEYKTYPKQTDRTKSVENPSPTERNYLEEALESRPFLKWLRSALRAVRSWQPPSSVSMKMSPRDEAMARLFRVVDLMDGSGEIAGMPSSVTMNFSLLNVWRAMMSNVIDTASLFLPGLNVTWFSGYDPQAANPSAASGEGSTASAAIPTQLLPQLDIGDLVGINGTNTAFSLAGGLAGLPFIVGPGLLGLLGLIGLAAPGKRKDNSCRRKDKGEGDDCPWYRRYDILGMLDGDDEEENDSNDDGDHQKQGNRLNRHKLQDSLDDVDPWLSPSADLHRVPPTLVKQLAQSKPQRTARRNNNGRHVDSGESEERQFRNSNRNGRRRDARENKVNNQSPQRGGRNRLESKAMPGHGKNNRPLKNKPAPPDYVDDIEDWAQRPSTTIAPPPNTTRKPRQNSARNSRQGLNGDVKGRKRLPLYKPPGVQENQQKMELKIEDYGGIATTVRAALEEFGLDTFDLSDPSLFFDDDLGPEANNYLQQSALVQNLLTSSPGAQHQQVQTPAAVSPTAAAAPLQQLTHSGVGPDGTTWNQVGQQYQNGYLNFDTAGVQTQDSQGAAGGATAAGGYPSTAQQQQQLTAATSIGGGQVQQQQQGYYASSPAASNYPQNIVDTSGNHYNNAAAVNSNQNYFTQTNPASSNTYQYNQLQQPPQQQAPSNNYQQQSSSDLVQTGYTNYGASILARGTSGAIAPDLTASNQLYNPTYSESYSVSATASPAAAPSAVGNAGYTNSQSSATSNSAYNNAGYDQLYQSQVGSDFDYSNQQQQQQQQQQVQQSYQPATARADYGGTYNYYGSAGAAGNYGQNGNTNYG